MQTRHFAHCDVTDIALLGGRPYLVRYTVVTNFARCDVTDIALLGGGPYLGTVKPLI